MISSSLTRPYADPQFVSISTMPHDECAVGLVHWQHRRLFQSVRGKPEAYADVLLHRLLTLAAIGRDEQLNSICRASYLHHCRCMRCKQLWTLQRRISPQPDCTQAYPCPRLILPGSFKYFAISYNVDALSCSPQASAAVTRSIHVHRCAVLAVRFACITPPALEAAK
jgi:hypothetical protein